MRGAVVAATALMLGGCIPRMEPPTDYGRPAPPPPPLDHGPPTTDFTPHDEAVAAQGTAPTRPVTRVAVPGAAARPLWEARPVEADARSVEASTYVVRPGDTLRGIAERTGAGVDAIARANGIAAPAYVVRIGQRLAIPAGRYHLVRTGQTGIAIARAYGVEWSRIVAANGLEEPYVLRAGQRILIPEAAVAPGSRAAERAAAFRLDVDDILTGGEPALAKNAAPVRPVARPKRPLPATVPVAPPRQLAGGGFLWPVDGRVVRRFGPGRSGERNDGIKIAVPLNTPIRATSAGVVAYAGDGIAALGGLIIIKHGDGWTSVYGHAAKLLVTRGQSVTRGQVIGLSGDTGFADQPELHFELRKGRTPVDPQGQLRR